MALASVSGAGSHTAHILKCPLNTCLSCRVGWGVIPTSRAYPNPYPSHRPRCEPCPAGTRHVRTSIYPGSLHTPMDQCTPCLAGESLPASTHFHPPLAHPFLQARTSRRPVRRRAPHVRQVRTRHVSRAPPIASRPTTMTRPRGLFAAALVHRHLQPAPGSVRMRCLPAR